MKFLIIDNASKIILTFTEDLKKASMLQDVLQDVSTSFILPKLHSSFYNKITEDELSTKYYKFFDFDIVEETNYPEYLPEKKEIAKFKLYCIRALLVCADFKMVGKGTFYDNNFASIIEKNENFLIEYSYLRNLNVEESKKDIELRVNNYHIALVKIQAIIDFYIEKITLAKYVNEILDLRNQIIKTFLFNGTISPS